MSDLKQVKIYTFLHTPHQGAFFMPKKETKIQNKYTIIDNQYHR